MDLQGVFLRFRPLFRPESAPKSASWLGIVQKVFSEKVSAITRMRQKCIRHASKMRQNVSCFIGKRGTFQIVSKMSQKCIKLASKMRGTPLGENTFWTIPIEWFWAPGLECPKSLKKALFGALPARALGTPVDGGRGRRSFCKQKNLQISWGDGGVNNQSPPRQSLENMFFVGEVCLTFSWSLFACSWASLLTVRWGAS